MSGLKISNIKSKAIVTVAVFLYTAVLHKASVSCAFLKITGVRCLGCGMTRALFAALRLNFVEAFFYHKMFWSVPVLYISFLRDGQLFKNKTVNIFIHFVIAFGFIFNWII